MRKEVSHLTVNTGDRQLSEKAGDFTCSLYVHTLMSNKNVMIKSINKSEQATNTTANQYNHKTEKIEHCLIHAKNNHDNTVYNF